MAPVCTPLLLHLRIATWHGIICTFLHYHCSSCGSAFHVMPEHNQPDTAEQLPHLPHISAAVAIHWLWRWLVDAQLTELLGVGGLQLHYIPAAGFHSRGPCTNKEVQWEVIEVIDMRKTRARRPHTAQRGKPPAERNKKSFDISTAGKPSIQIACVASPPPPCQRHISQQAEEAQGSKHAFWYSTSNANSITTFTKKQRLRHKSREPKPDC